MSMGSRCGRSLCDLGRMRTRMGIGAARIVRMRVVGGFTEHAIDQCGIVENAIAEIGVLRAGAGEDAKHMGMQPPERGQLLAECSAEQSVPGARAGLEFRFK